MTLATPAKASTDVRSDDAALVLDADYYGFQQQLTMAEQKSVARVRDFLERHVRPRADELWEKAESPRHLIPQFADGLETMCVGGGQGMALILERL